MKIGRKWIVKLLCRKKTKSLFQLAISFSSRAMKLWKKELCKKIRQNVTLFIYIFFKLLEEKDFEKRVKKFGQNRVVKHSNYKEYKYAKHALGKT